MTCTQRTLNILEAMVRKMESGQRIEIADVRIVLTLLAMVSRQADEQAVLNRIEEALNIRRGQEFVRNCRELSNLLKNQISKEQVGAALAPEVSTSFFHLERKYVPQSKEKTVMPVRAFSQAQGSAR